MLKKLYRSSCKVPVMLVSILMNFEFSKQIFEKCSNIKSHENPSGVSRDVACEQTDGKT